MKLITLLASIPFTRAARCNPSDVQSCLVQFEKKFLAVDESDSAAQCDIILSQGAVCFDGCPEEALDEFISNYADGVCRKAEAHYLENNNVYGKEASLSIQTVPNEPKVTENTLNSTKHSSTAESKTKKSASSSTTKTKHSKTKKSSHSSSASSTSTSNESGSTDQVKTASDASSVSGDAKRIDATKNANESVKFDAHHKGSVNLSANKPPAKTSSSSLDVSPSNGIDFLKNAITAAGVALFVFFI